MKKTHLNQLTIILLVTITLFATSCTSSPKNMDAVPKDAAVVFTIDFYSMAEKGKFSEVSKFSFVELIKKELRNENKELAEVLEAFIENPRITGINFKQDFITFIAPKEGESMYKSSPYVGLTAELTSGSDFESFIIDIYEKAGKELEVIKDEKSGKKYVKLQPKTILGWDSDKVLLIGGGTYLGEEDEIVEVFGKYMTLKKGERLLTDENFKTYAAGQRDFGMWMSTDFIESLPGGKDMKFGNVEFTDSYLTLDMNFEQDELVMKTNFEPNKELGDFYSKLLKGDDEVNDDLLNYMPENTYALMRFSANPEGYYSMLEKSGLMMFMGKGFEREMGMTIEEAFKSFKGNMVASLIDFRKEEYMHSEWERTYDEETGDWDWSMSEPVVRERPMPVFAATMDLNNSKFVEKLLELGPDSLKTDKGGYYALNMDDVIIYLAYNNKQVIISNGEDVAKNFKSGGFKKNLSTASIITEFNNPAMLFYINTQYSALPDVLKIMIEKEVSGPGKQMIQIWDGLAKDIVVIGTDNFNGEMRVRTKELKQNFLYTIFKTIEDNYKAMMVM